MSAGSCFFSWSMRAVVLPEEENNLRTERQSPTQYDPRVLLRFRVLTSSLPFPCPFMLNFASGSSTSLFPAPASFVFNASTILPATIRTTALGVGPPLVSSRISLSCTCPCVVKTAQSIPFVCKISPNLLPSSLSGSTAELIISVGGCNFACAAVMLIGAASSSSRSSASGTYIA
jgi:hypothetical protein